MMAAREQKNQVSYELESCLKAMKLLGRKSIQVVAIGIDAAFNAGILAQTFDTSDPELITWVKERNPTHNLYFTLNEAAASPNKKPSERDITCVHGIGFDCDPIKELPLEEEKQRLRKLGQDMLLNAEYPPTYVIMTGNGIQGVFLLKEPRCKFDSDHIKGLGKRLQTALGADTTANLDRLYRLPGTVNRPTPSKKKRGCVQEQSGIMIPPKGCKPRKYALEEL